MKKFIALAFTILGSLSTAMSQEQLDMSSLSGWTHRYIVQGEDHRYTIQNGIQIEAFWAKTPPDGLMDIRNYHLYRVNVAKGSAPLAEINDAFRRSIESTEIGVAPLPNPLCEKENCRIALNAPLALGEQYMLFIDDVEGKRVWTSVSFAAKTTISDPLDANKKGRQILISSKVPMEIPSAPAIQLQQTILEESKDSLYVEEKTKPIAIKDEVVSQRSSRSRVLTLAHKLQDGVIYSMKVPKQVTTSSGATQNGGIFGADTTTPLEASGKIEMAGLPTKPDDPKIQVSLSSLSAVGQKSVLDLVGNIAPRHQPINNFAGRYCEEIAVSCEKRYSPWFFEPQFIFDVGLRSTKSNNSVTLNFPFTNYWMIAKKRVIPDSEIQAATSGTKRIGTPTYAGWVRTPWYRLADVKLSVGPKTEFDRKFQRFNLLGNFRADFEFHRWLGTIKNKRDLILLDIANNKDEQKVKSQQLSGITRGFKIVPYLSFDLGGHMNNETVEKTVSGKHFSLLVPRHGIFRSTMGVANTFEWNSFRLPTTLSFDGSWIYMARLEQIGLTTATGVALRQLKGFHPHLKSTLDLALDPAKHYSFTLIYENGRTAPNFEYLNKMSAGVKLAY